VNYGSAEIGVQCSPQGGFGLLAEPKQLVTGCLAFLERAGIEVGDQFRKALLVPRLGGAQPVLQEGHTLAGRAEQGGHGVGGSLGVLGR
jgi:hypothetical protein